MRPRDAVIPRKVVLVRASAIQLGSPRRLNDQLGRDPDLSTNLLKFGERQPLARWQLTLRGVLCLVACRLLEDGGDFLLIEPSNTSWLPKI